MQLGLSGSKHLRHGVSWEKNMARKKVYKYRRLPWETEEQRDRRIAFLIRNRDNQSLDLRKRRLANDKEDWEEVHSVFNCTCAICRLMRFILPLVPRLSQSVMYVPMSAFLRGSRLRGFRVHANLGEQLHPQGWMKPNEISESSPKSHFIKRGIRRQP